METCLKYTLIVYYKLNYNYSTAESRSVSSTTSFLGVYTSPIQSTAQVGFIHTNVVFITAVSVSAGFLLMLLVVILVTIVLLLGVRHKQKRGIYN